VSEDRSSISWRKDYFLKENDFVGGIDPTSSYQAESHTTLSYFCEFDDKETSSRFKKKIKNIRVVAFFNPSLSWLKKDEVSANNMSDLLKHEQGHFDGAEEFARKLQKYLEKEFVGKTITCAGETETERSDSLNKILKKKSHKISADLGVFHRTYDNETNHGRISTTQKEYNKRFDLLREE